MGESQRREADLRLSSPRTRAHTKGRSRSFEERRSNGASAVDATAGSRFHAEAGHRARSVADEPEAGNVLRLAGELGAVAELLEPEVLPAHDLDLFRGLRETGEELLVQVMEPLGSAVLAAQFLKLVDREDGLGGE